MSPRRMTTRALLPLALHGLAREVDSALGTMLETSLDLPGLVPEALSLLQPGRTLARVLAWLALGSLVWALLAMERARREGSSFREALDSESGTFGPLYLRPALTLVALVSLAVVPTFPYGFTLPVALTQDLGLAQDVAALAALVALRAPALRLPAPGWASVFFLAFLAYSFLAPGWARLWDGHPGNQPKTLRMAVSLGHELSLDAEGVSAPMEELTPRPFLPAAADAAATLARESALLARASMGGAETLGAGAIRASRITRQTIRGKDGGVYYVLPPGPSAVLAPALGLDRALNLARGTPGRLDVTLLLWNTLAAALVAAVFALARDASGRPGLAALVAGGFALTPPFVFYSYQFYPEMLGALVLALVFRWLFFVPRWTPAGLLVLGGLLASLPWLHQKFLPVWGVLVLTALILAVHRLVTFKALLALLLPQLATLYLQALYNFAITGSARPDALYLAWGPQGVTAARIPEGLLGLLLDARFGILPYVPLYVVAVAGLMLPGRGAARLRLALPAAAVYYATVASADNWSGAVCNLGRYFMPLTPLLAAGVAVALARLGSRRGVLALTLTLAAWTGLWSLQLWRDPHAADDCALLLAKSTYADGHVYIPNIFYRSWNYAAPGHWARIGAWLGLLGAGVAWFRRAAAGRGGGSPCRALAGLAVILLSLALTLERWPSPHNSPRFQARLELGPGTTLFVGGSARLHDEIVHCPGGEVRISIRSRTPLADLRLEASGDGWLRAPGLPRLFLAGRAVTLDTPLQPLRTLTGRRGMEETLYDLRLSVETHREIRLRFPGAPSRPE